MTPKKGNLYCLGFSHGTKSGSPICIVFWGGGRSSVSVMKPKGKPIFVGSLAGGKPIFVGGGRGSAFSVPGKGGGKGGKEARGKSELTSRPRQGPGDALLLGPAAREPQGHGARGALGASDETPAARSAGNEAKRKFVR